MLSFLHRWDCWWKSEFDADVKIENYNQHDGENYFFKKKLVHIKRQSKKKDILVIFMLLLYNPLYCCKKRRTPIYLIKTVPKRNLKRTLFHNSTWRKLTWMNCNWTGKLQVTLLSAHISRKKLCSETSQSLFGRSNCDVFWENEGNMHVGGCVIEVFLLTCRLAPASRHLATS